MTPEQRRSPAQIEDDIARTRAELGVTVDALAYQLDARLLLQKGLDMIADSISGGDSRVGDAIRANPIPVALIGLGAAWLIAANTGVFASIAQDDRIQAARRRIAAVGDKVGETVGITGHPQIDAPEGEGRPDGWVHQATDAARGALRSVRETGGAVIGRAGEYAGQAGEAARIPERVADVFTRYPLLVGALVAVAGAAAAALLPVSRAEEELLGEARDNLRDRAAVMAREAVERVRDIAAAPPR